MTLASPPHRLAQLLVHAQREHTPLTELDAALQPRDKLSAYQTQEEIFRLNAFETGGWKIGSKSATGPVQGSPLPKSCLFASASTFARSEHALGGLELEIAFRFGCAFAPREAPYSEEEVLGGIHEMAATIEIVSSRFAAFPAVDPLTQLADLLNHGALVVGQFVPYQADFDFLHPSLSFTLNDQSIVPSVIANPAGDPRRLLTWLVNHHTEQGKKLREGFVITTGSYTGMHFAQTSGSVEGRIHGLPGVSLKLT
ncbi:2-keto-4-pentenoate hydratase [Pseudomonas gingeri]|uniref:2-keto-4-pentenoate hydratase n=1 Tax=Pseudomonas gingeri TaxID=117681 RepID=A0A7Y7WEA5_9PSED|nr:2-keto-4-pentenoate hydratase [Pseudomonas gingeri]NWB47837.1 2-keto-4-pentenoate hydratase [Pseudomonas gingeri]